MKKLLWFAFGLSVAAAAPALAANPVPDMTGTWKATAGNAILGNGNVNTIPDDFDAVEIAISDQKGSVFKAVQTVKPKAGRQAGVDAGKPIEGQPTPLIGAIDGDDRSVVLVDVGDTTTIQCIIEDENTMRCTFVEPGENAIAGFMVLERDN